jgi:glycosyltransferase involved in cell wall biosynthesis
MIHGQKVIVVMPAYNAARTLRQTFGEIPKDVVDDVILVDDASSDSTAAVARELGVRLFVHSRNLGYGGNQKSCYTLALQEGADIVVMLHPDYQYTPRLVTAMASMVASGEYDVVLGSRILGTGALLTSLQYRLARWGLARCRFLSPDGRRLSGELTHLR